MLRVLVVEDELHNREALTEIISRAGHEPLCARDGQEALELCSQKIFDLILSDIRMPNLDGVGFFEALQGLNSQNGGVPPFVFMTAYGRLDEAVEAMRRGALHFLTKPLKKKDVTAILEEAQRLSEKKRQLQSSVSQQAAFKNASDEANPVFASKKFAETLQLIDKIAPTQTSVLLMGESGTGKEVLARRLHQNSQRQGRFVPFHAGAMPETLIESELFGHERGAFTGADQARPGLIRSAHQGTFFWDELASMPIGIQAKLLRVVQDRSVQPLGGTQSVHCEVRWVSATNENLDHKAKEGLFREDLLYRLAVVAIEVPALRERPEDIEVLTRHFIAQFCERESKKALWFSPSLLETLKTYSWPGNVRELRNVVERAVVLASDDEFSVDLLPQHISLQAKAREIRVLLGSTLQLVEDKLIEETLKFCNGDKNKAAAILGVAPRTLYRWIERKEQQNDGSV